MECEWVKDHLQEYIDRELGLSEELVLKEHLSSCDRCSYEHEKIVAAWKALDVWEDLTPPARIQKNVFGSIRRRHETKWSKMFLPVAAVLFIAISITFYFRETETKKHHDVTAANRAAPLRLHTEITAENEADIIANLQLLREKEFYDSLDRLQKIDYLPLVEDHQKEEKKDQRSFLELPAA